jgi:quinohemoprotein ethanol dehydrogenase
VKGEQYVAVMAGYGGSGALSGGDPRTMASAKYVNEGHVLAFRSAAKSRCHRLPSATSQSPEPPVVAANTGGTRERQVQVHEHVHGVPRRARYLGRRRARPASAARREARHLQGHRVRRRDSWRRHAADVDLITEQDVHDIQAYIVLRAKQDRGD